MYALNDPRLDEALLDALLSGVRDALTCRFVESTPLLERLDATVSEALLPFAPSNAGIQGEGCSVLWTVLREPTPANMSQLSHIVDFEKIVDRFDSACRSHEAPMESLVQLRISFSRALTTMASNPDDVQRLSMELDALTSNLPNGTSEGQDQPPQLVFGAVFGQLYQRYAIGSLDGDYLSLHDCAALEILAQRTTRESLGTISELPQDRPALRSFRLLRCALSPSVFAGETAVTGSSWQKQALVCAADVPKVSIGSYDLLMTESKFLSRTVAKYAHVLVKDDLPALDSLLKQLSTTVLNALASDPRNTRLYELAIQVQSSMNNPPKRSSVSPGEIRGFQDCPSLHMAAEQLSGVLHYCQSPPAEPADRLQHAAKAWTDLAVTCLTLFIPNRPFDPALKPLLEREVYHHINAGLTGQLHALRSFRETLYGDGDCMRARALQDDLRFLGSAPAYVQICRPEISDLDALQGDFDGLMRAITTHLHGAMYTQNADGDYGAFWANLLQLRQRLCDRYRAYADLTMPVVGFIDCLRVAYSLKSRVRYVNRGTGALTLLAGLTPMINGSFAGWMSDNAFVYILSHGLEQHQMMLCLSNVALRCTIRPMAIASLEMQDAVEDVFTRLYDQWKTKLREDQRHALAKSSMYRFKGSDDLTDDAEDGELNHLFPARETQASGETEHRSSRTDIEVRGVEVAQAHHAIFRPQSTLAGEDIGQLLQKFSIVVAGSEANFDGDALMAVTIRSLQTLAGDVNGRSASRSYNIYTDANVQQIRKLCALLQKTKARFRELHQAWPEHATPVEVLRSCDQMLHVSYSTALTAILPGVESLHAKITEWQQIASREYTVQDILDEITGLIVSWRQLELSSWSGILDREASDCNTDAATWWYVAYESIIVASRNFVESSTDLERHVKELLKTLDGFLANCGLGEFMPRLTMLQDFAAHLANSTQASPSLKVAADALRVFITHYQYFESTVAGKLAKGRADLEKEIKNVIQVASWKDRNVETLKQSANKSHKKLLRLVRKFRALLAQPATTILSSGIPMTVVRARATVGKEHSDETQYDLAGASILMETETQSWRERPDRYRHVLATAGMIHSKTQDTGSMIDTPQRLRAFVEELVSAIAELRKATPSEMNEATKPAVQHLKTRKRRLLADTLKSVRVMGFQTSLSQDALAQQASSDTIFASCLALPVGSDLVSSHLELAEYHFHRLLDIMPTVRESARRPSEELTPAEVARSLSLIESMLHSVVRQRRALVQHLQPTNELRVMSQMFNAFATSSQPRLSNTHDQTATSLAARSRYLVAILGECESLTQTQGELGGLDYQNALNRLRDLSARLRNHRDQCVALSDLPNGIIDASVRECEAQLHSLADDLHSVAVEAARTHPELVSVMSQLCNSAKIEALNQHGKANGLHVAEADIWVAELLQLLDYILGAVQEAELIGANGRMADDGQAWLFGQHHKHNRQLHALRVPQVATKLSTLLGQLPSLRDKSGHVIADIAAVCKSIRPIVTAYVCANDTLAAGSSQLHCETVKMASELASSFAQLAQHGFCTPSEKAEGPEQAPAGIETGTGLGDGEGGEDISKEVGDSEDLSELAQDTKTAEKSDGIEDEKDAVDMADEELQGELADVPSPTSDAGGEDEEDERNDEVEEEAGEVDDLAPSALDEKMWDEGSKQDQADKETNEPKSSTKEQDLTAANDAKLEKDDIDQDSQELSQGADEQEEVRPLDTEQLDPHTQNQENLDLPEDVSMGADDPEELGDSEIDSLADDGVDGDVVPEDAATKDKILDDLEPENFELSDQDLVDDDNDETQDADDTSVEPRPAEPQDSTQDTAAAERGADGNGDLDDAADYASNDVEKSNDKPMSQSQPQQEKAESGDENMRTEGGEGGNQEQHQASEADAAAQEKSSNEPSAFKQIGDVLDEWYRQHRSIQSAQQPDDAAEQKEAEVDLPNARFQHIHDESEAADTQALGTTSAQQSAALNEEDGLAMNEHEDPKPFMTDPNQPEDAEMQDDVAHSQQMQIDPSDIARTGETSKAYVGDYNDTNDDIDMDAHSPASHDEDDETVDEQLLRTHISVDDAVEDLSLEQARHIWSNHEASTRSLALILTEHLRLILQPTQPTRMRGDFRTGKRLNIKRIIPYIASSYKRDKIWMRRSMPSKRSYQVILAIDDSKSMAESHSQALAFDTLALVAKSMAALEVGDLSVVAFGEDVKVAHAFDVPFTSDAGARAVGQFRFDQSRTNVRKLLAESIQLFQAARMKAAGSARDLWQLLLIISDGVCEDHPTIRQLVRQAHEERIMVVFIVVDVAAQTAASPAVPRQSIVDLQTAEFVKDDAGEMVLTMVKYLETFPFKYYLMVRDVEELPGVLAAALRQWLAKVMETG